VPDERSRLLAQRASLLARMRNAAWDGGTDPVRRVHLTLAIDRFLARLLATADPDSWVLKGGYANQLRAPNEARFTEDVDLRIDAPLGRAAGIIAAATAADIDDLLGYEIVGDPRVLDGPPCGGLRFSIAASLVGSSFVSFAADVNSGDALVGGLEEYPSDPIVSSLGFVASSFPVYPVSQQFAEKLHVLTLPRTQPNTRVKDLPDMIWYTERYTFESGRLIDSCVATFDRRAAHPWAPLLPRTPASWAAPFRAMRAELGIVPATPAEAMVLLGAFLDPIFAGRRGELWDPDLRHWDAP